MERVQPEVAAGVGEEEEVVESSRGQEEGLRGHEDERIAAILERIQAIKPEYKQRVEALQRGEHRDGSNGVRNGGHEDQQSKLLRTPSKEAGLLQGPVGPKEGSRRENEVLKREESKEIGRRDDYREAVGVLRREDGKEQMGGRREDPGKEGACRREDHKDRDRGREDYKES